MALQYIKTSWMNSSGTPLNAESLNHIEDGIDNVTKAVNDLDEAAAKKSDVKTQLDQLNALIMNLDVSDSAKSQQFVTAVSQDNGKIEVSRRGLNVADLPVNIPKANIQSLETDLRNINQSITQLGTNLSDTNSKLDDHSTTSSARFDKIDEITGVDSTLSDNVESSLSDRLNAVENINYEDRPASTDETTPQQFVTAVSQEDTKINVTKAPLRPIDLPDHTHSLSDVTDLENTLNDKASVEDVSTLSTTVNDLSNTINNTSETLRSIESVVENHTNQISSLTQGSMTIATTDILGGVKVGEGLKITTDGVLSTTALQPASKNTLGAVIIGDNIEVDEAGRISSVAATEVVDSLDSDSTTAALSAAQGKTLKGLCDLFGDASGGYYDFKMVNDSGTRKFLDKSNNIITFSDLETAHNNGKILRFWIGDDCHSLVYHSSNQFAFYSPILSSKLQHSELYRLSKVGNDTNITFGSISDTEIDKILKRIQEVENHCTWQTF